jgi:transposase
MAGIEIFQGRARRRWTDADKRQLVAETLAPDATVHAVARRHGVSTSQLFTWRKRFRGELGFPRSTPAAPAFAAVALAPAGASLPGDGTLAVSGMPTSAGVIEIELPHGERVRIAGVVDPAMVTAALQVLVRR